MNTLEKFFTGKFFKIPAYQRDYAWSIDNIDDLFEDIIESIETQTAHYIGTFILSKKEEDDCYYVVDGQQRLTTLSMIFNCSISLLKSDTDKIIYTDKFIKSNEIHRLELLNENHRFFQGLLNRSNGHADNKSQKLLVSAYEHIESRLNTLNNVELTPESFLDALKKLEVMEFIEKNEGKAIRIFQTVNDRGKPLSNMEKAKSLLIYYSNRFLNGSLDNKVNTSFGNIFKYFNKIKEVAEEYAISLLSQKNFTEDSIMRYHFLAYENEFYNYNATVNDVLEVFLKSKLKQIKNSVADLSSFIDGYVNDLERFFETFLRLINKCNQKKYYKIFSVLDLSTFLYPLAIRLEMRNLLDSNLIHNSGQTFLDLIEVADVRVYKTRGTDPIKDISFLAKDSAFIPPLEVEDRLRGFISWFMNDSEFRNRLSGHVYGNRAMKHIFIEYDEQLLKDDNKSQYTVEQVVKLNSTTPTVEHIFPQERPFAVPNKGFDTEDDYLIQLHRFGNLMLLEKSINSQCKNHTPDKKVIDSKLYSKSSFVLVNKFVANQKNNGISFCSEDISSRTEDLVKFCIGRWNLS